MDVAGSAGGLEADRGRLRIVEVATGYTPVPARVGAATELVVEALCRAFVGLGQEVEMIDAVASERGQLDWPAREVWLPGTLRRTSHQLGLRHKVKRVVYSLGAARVLSGVLRRTGKPCVVHFHNQYNAAAALGLLSKSTWRGVRTAYTVHTPAWSASGSVARQIVRRRYFLERYSIRKADIVIGLSERAVENIRGLAGVARDRIAVLRNGVDVVMFRPLGDEPEVRRRRESFGLGERRVLLSVGTINERKNQLGIVRALEPLMREGVAGLVLAGGIGDPGYFGEVDRYVRDVGLAESVRYVGEVQPGVELNEYYNAADALVVLSRGEALSLVVLEALAAGRPVVMSEMLRSDLLSGGGKGVIWVDHDDVAGGVRAEIVDPQRWVEHSMQARAFALASLSWARVAAEHLEVFWDAMAGEVTGGGSAASGRALGSI